MHEVSLLSFSQNTPHRQVLEVGGRLSGGEQQTLALVFGGEDRDPSLISNITLQTRYQNCYSKRNTCIPFP